MRFSLSNLLLVVTSLALAIGWWFDHSRLTQANARLNAEAGELFSLAVMDSGTGSLLQLPANLSPQRSYNFSIPEDRAAYRRNYGKPGPFGEFIR